jgi:phosphoserine phosphatase RsbU/P
VPVRFLPQLNWLQRITLIFFVTVVTNWIVASQTGYSLIGGDLFTVLLIVFCVLLVITLLPPVVRKAVWRVRNRLLVTYFFVGVLPVLLMAAFVYLGFYLVLGRISSSMMNSELQRREEQLYLSAQRLAVDLATGRGRTTPALPREEVIVSTGNRPREFPQWSKPGFKGLVRSADDRFFAAHAAFRAEGARHAAEVFSFQPLDEQTLSQLLPGVASAMLISGASLTIEIGKLNNQDVRLVLDSGNVTPAPAARGFWDVALESPLAQEVRSFADGQAHQEVLVIQSRPSAILAQLFSTLGSLATTLGFLLMIIAIALLVVIIAGILFSSTLTRTLTRSVHDLYAGTKKVEAGDFSHRIPVRTKDQLSELAQSFNQMTARIERLIVEVKEKEKLEAELEIARQVQSQLFPKEVPKLQTLELRGLCNPARVVSGDYYDFITIDARSTALVIGDIAGKGISAALLMASLQSSLHAQLTLASNGGISTATLVSRLNQQLYENTSAEKYATFYCGVYDDQNGLLAYTNAGHLAPILVRRGSVIRLESNGMVVGMFPGVPYEQSVIQLQSGDLLTAFTDGITEAENKQGEQFGDRRLTDLLLLHRERPLDEIVLAITDAVKDWATDIDDDTTLLLARRL